MGAVDPPAAAGGDGGSGGPVLALDGKVVAVNAAILPEFAGSNLGVPVAMVRELLEKQHAGTE